MTMLAFHFLTNILTQFQCGKDKVVCLEYLKMESERLSRGPYARHNHKRKLASGSSTNFKPFSLHSSGLPSASTSFSSISTFQSSDNSSSCNLRSVNLPFHFCHPHRTTSFSGSSKLSSSSVRSSNDSIPMVVLTADSPTFSPQTLYKPSEEIQLQHSKRLTSLGLHLSPNENHEFDDEDDICSLSTTTVSQTAISISRNNTLKRNTISVSSSRSSCSSQSSCSTCSRNGFKQESEFLHDNFKLMENPFRKVFIRRKEFYQRMENNKGKVSKRNPLWCQRLCSLCSKSCMPKLLTLNANIEPFAPFVIQHDLSTDNQKIVMETNNNLMLVRDCSGGDLMDGAKNEIRYATSAINSEEGLESHLEVSLNKDGSSVITTRHKRLGSPSEMSNNSVLHLKYGEGGNVLNIRQSQHLSSPASKNVLHNRSGRLCQGKERPNSAYCTMQNPFHSSNTMAHILPPRYNSLPNLNGRSGLFDNGSNFWLYNPHPADEEKRLAYTRGNLASLT